MPIDASIALQGRLPQIESPLNALAKVSQVKNAMNQNRLFDMQVAEGERKQASQNALMQVHRDAFDQNTGRYNNDKIRRGLGGLGDYKAFTEFEKSQTDQAKSALELRKAKIEEGLKQFEAMGQIMSGAKDQASYDAARQSAVGILGQEAVANMPTVYDPVAIEQGRLKAMSVKEQMEQMRKELELRMAKPEKIDDGQQLSYRDMNPNSPTYGQETAGAPVRKMQSPDSVASIAQQERNSKRVDARARETNAAGKAPSGYRYTPDGNLQAIPGGPADIKAGEVGAKRERQQQGALDQADRIIAKVDQSLEKVGLNTAGFGGSAMSVIPGSESRDLKSDLETIKANLGFAELQAMRDASPTGGALGQVAVQELIALQSTVASLDQAQSPAQLKARLGEVKKHYENWKNAVKESSGARSTSPNAPPQIKTDADFNALPSGAEFIDPNGNRRRKP